MITTLNEKVPIANQTDDSIPGRFARAVSLFGERIAVSAPEAELTYAQLEDCSTRTARVLLNRLGEKSEPVVLLMAHGVQLITAILAVLKAGKMYLALDPDNPTERLAAMLSDSCAGLVLTDKANASLAHSLASNGVGVLEMTDKSASLPSTTLPEVLPETGAWLMYTSGSTGKPKGVWQNHRGIMQQTDVYADLIQITPDDRLSLLTSCSLSASATPLFAALLNGATLCPFHVRSQGVERLAKWLRERRITVYHSVPTVFRHLARVAGNNQVFESLRLVRLGGEPVLRSDVEIYRKLCPNDCRLLHSFSSSETGSISALMINKQSVLPERRVPAGHALTGVEILLLDEHGQSVTNGNVGRIAVSGDSLRQGYWRQPDITAENYRPHPHDPNTKVFVTNDLGRFLPDGRLEHLGRADQVVKIHGHRVDMAEVEAALRATDLVEDVVVVTRESSNELQLIAYVVPRVASADIHALCRRKLRQRLPDYMIPEEVVPLDKLPQTAGGKLDRRALPEIPVRSQVPQPILPTHRGGIEKKLVRIWQTALGIPSVDRKDDFFDLGGTSLQSVEVLARIEEHFSVALPPSTLTEYSTIEQLAALISNNTVLATPRPLVVLRAAKAGRPLFFIHSGQGDVTTYGQLVRRLSERPIYGLQALGLQGERWPLMSVRAMADRYLPEILEADPHGPYLLAGSCMGGLVALEIAKQLAAKSKPVALVVMFDTTAPPWRGKRARWMELLLDTLRDVSRIVRGWFLWTFGSRRNSRWLPTWRRFVANMTGMARFYYRPGFYPGTITHFMTVETRYPKEDRRSLMARYAREAHNVSISGKREGLFIRPTVEELARQLQVCLDEAERKAAS